MVEGPVRIHVAHSPTHRSIAGWHRGRKEHGTPLSKFAYSIMVVPTTKDTYEELLHQNPITTPRPKVYYRFPQVGNPLVDFAFDTYSDILVAVHPLAVFDERLG